MTDKIGTTWQISNVRLFDGETYHGEQGGICVEEGTIKDLGPHLKKPVMPLCLDGADHALCPGFVDGRVRLKDFSEMRLRQLVAQAHQGGVTTVALHAEDPLRLTPSQIHKGQRMTATYPIRFVFVGSATSQQTIGEIGLMHRMGIRLFADSAPLANAQQAARWFRYTQPYGVSLWEPSEEPSLTQDGLVDDGSCALRLGLEGRPAIAESVLIERDSILAQAYRGRVIIGPISSQEGLDALQRVRMRNSSTHGVTAWPYLLLDHSVLRGYRSEYKLFPPLRDEEDVHALRDACLEAFDMIVSDHIHHHRDSKRQPFVKAAVGREGLADFLSNLKETSRRKGCSWDCFLPLVTKKPAAILGIYSGLKIGAEADILVFDDGPGVSGDSGDEEKPPSLSNQSTVPKDTMEGARTLQQSHALQHQVSPRFLSCRGIVVRQNLSHIAP